MPAQGCISDGFTNVDYFAGRGYILILILVSRICVLSLEIWIIWLREAAKKVFFFSGPTTTRGREVRDWSLVRP